MAAIAVAGVGLMVVCSSSLAAVMMMGGEEETPATTTSAGPTAPTIPSGQYVKLVHTVAQDNSAAGNEDDKNKILNLAELEVFAKGGTTSIAAGKTVTGTAISVNFPGTNLVDGNMTNFAHTFGRDATVKDEFTVDLGSVQEIEKIKITNRVDCCKNRAIGIKAVILGADGTTVVKETPAISTTADTYTFTFPGTAWA
jgi:transcription elongation factor